MDPGSHEGPETRVPFVHAPVLSGVNVVGLLIMFMIPEAIRVPLLSRDAWFGLRGGHLC